MWWGTPLIPALERQRQVDLCELEASLVYRLSSKTALHTDTDTDTHTHTHTQSKKIKDNVSLSMKGSKRKQCIFE